MRKYFVDLRLPPLERARLGARGTIFASRTVNRLFNRLQAEASTSLFITHPRHDGDRLVARMRVGRALDELQAAIRRELGADTSPWSARRLGTPAPETRRHPRCPTRPPAITTVTGSEPERPRHLGGGRCCGRRRDRGVAVQPGRGIADRDRAAPLARQPDPAVHGQLPRQRRGQGAARGGADGAARAGSSQPGDGDHPR
jgi:hypothetical protein